MASAPATTIESDYAILLEGCGVLDRSARGKLALTGAGAVEFLNGQVTNELATLRPGDGVYAAFLTAKGKMLGDLRVLATGADAAGEVCELLLDTERVALQALFDMIRRYKIGYEVQVHKRTLERGLLSLIGPAAATVAGAEGLDEAEHANALLEVGGVATVAVRTDVGVDLICDSLSTPQLSQALRDRGAAPVSERAVECLRIESGRPRYGLELDDTVIPQEAGLNERAVSFTKGCYVGQETVARLYYKGKPNRHLRGLRISEPATRGQQLLLGERPVGHVASTTESPALGPLALALVRREAQPGSTVSVGELGASAEVCELPFAGSSAPVS